MKGLIPRVIEIWSIGVVVVLVGRSGFALIQWSLAVWFVVFASLQLAGSSDETAMPSNVILGLCTAGLCAWNCSFGSRRCDGTYFYTSCVCFEAILQIACIFALVATLILHSLAEGSDAAYIERLVLSLAPPLGALALARDARELAFLLAFVTALCTCEPLASTRDLQTQASAQSRPLNLKQNVIPVKTSPGYTAWFIRPKQNLSIGSRTAALLCLSSAFVPATAALGEGGGLVAVLQIWGIAFLTYSGCSLMIKAALAVSSDEPRLSPGIPWWCGPRPREFIQFAPRILSALTAIIASMAIPLRDSSVSTFAFSHIAAAVAAALLVARLLSTSRTDDRRRKKAVLGAAILLGTGLAILPSNIFLGLTAAAVWALSFPGQTSIFMVPFVHLALSAAAKEEAPSRWLMSALCVGLTVISGSAWAICLSLSIVGLLWIKNSTIHFALSCIRLLAASDTSCAEVQFFNHGSIKPRILLALASLPGGRGLGVGLLFMSSWLVIDFRLVYPVAMLFGAAILTRGDIVSTMTIFCAVQAYHDTRTVLWLGSASLGLLAMAGLGTPIALTLGAVLFWLENTPETSALAVLCTLFAAISIHDASLTIALVSALGLLAVMRHISACSTKKQAEFGGDLAVIVSALGAGCSGLFLITGTHQMSALAVAACMKTIASLSARNTAHRLLIKALEEDDSAFTPSSTKTGHVLINTVSAASDVSCIDAYALTVLTAAACWRGSTAFALAAPVLIILRRPNHTARALRRKVQSSRYSLVVHSKNLTLGTANLPQLDKVERTTDHLAFDLSSGTESSPPSKRSRNKDEDIEKDAAIRAIIPLAVAVISLFVASLLKISAFSNTLDIFLFLPPIPVLILTFVYFAQLKIPDSDELLAAWPLALAPAVAATQPEVRLFGIVAAVTPPLTAVLCALSSYVTYKSGP